jgi:hypothetical protein
MSKKKSNKPKKTKEAEPMKLFRVPVNWCYGSEMEIEAHTAEEAIQKAYDCDSLPDDGDYLDGSFEVIEEAVEEVYPPE